MKLLFFWEVEIIYSCHKVPQQSWVFNLDEHSLETTDLNNQFYHKYLHKSTVGWHSFHAWLLLCLCHKEALRGYHIWIWIFPNPCPDPFSQCMPLELWPVKSEILWIRAEVCIHRVVDWGETWARCPGALCIRVNKLTGVPHELIQFIPHLASSVCPQWSFV